MGQTKKKNFMGGGIASLGRSFEYIAYSYGMTAERAENVLAKEFKRVHKGTSYNNYILVHTWETLRADPQFKEMADYALRLLSLPALEKIAGIRNKLPKDWSAEYAKLLKTRTKKNYSNNIKVIASRITRVLRDQKKDYKAWKQTKVLFKNV